VKPIVRFPGSGVQRGLVFSSGLKGLPFSIPIDLSMSIMTLSRGSVVGDRGVEHRAQHVNESGRRRVGRLGQWIELDALSIGHGLGHVGGTTALEDGPQQDVALISVGRQSYVIFRQRLGVARGRNTNFPPLPSSKPAGTTPSSAACHQSTTFIGDSAVIACGRNLHHDRPGIPRC
jgi:hypothetical protein